MDSRLVWKAGKWSLGSLALPQKTHVLSGENQARVVAIDPGVRAFATVYADDVVGILVKVIFSYSKACAFETHPNRENFTRSAAQNACGSLMGNGSIVIKSAHGTVCSVLW
jgi:transposase